MKQESEHIMKQTNPFSYSDDNKRYHTYNYYLRHHFNNKVYKVPLNAGFTCPNRDGRCGVGGCTFCTPVGSGEFAGELGTDLLTQYEQGRNMMEQKWPHGLTIPYFQSFTNTYGSLEKIQQCLTPFLSKEEVVAISLATRADCLEQEKIDYLASCTQQKEIWIELGVQSVHDLTAQFINRGHDFKAVQQAIQRCQNTPIKVCLHLINGLPNESEEMMLETIRQVNQLPIHAIKLHMLHLMKQTTLAKQFEKQPFPILTREQYVKIVVKQLQLLRPEIIIQRLTGDGESSNLVAPEWTKKKTIVLNEIDKEMVLQNVWQGKALL